MIAIVLVAFCLALGYAATAAFGPVMVPPPPVILGRLLTLSLEGDVVVEGARTFARAAVGILFANIAGSLFGLCAGMVSPAARLFRPLLTAINACPPVVWIAFAMVWLGTGGGTPIFTVAAAALPPIFLATVEGVRAIDPRLTAMSRLYRVPFAVRVRQLILPGAFPFWRAAFAHTTAAAWKVAAVAEFFGSGDGVGARIYWTYRRLEMADFYAWALVIMAFGVAVDTGLAAFLRMRGGKP